MDAAADPLALESLLAFWADAGVDACLEVAPVDRLAPRARPNPPPAVVAAPSPAPATAGFAAPSFAGGDPAATAAGVADMNALERAFAAFEIGGLRPGGTRAPVWRRGVEAPSVLVFGGLPGADEEGGGQAFAGAAGRLLDRMLAAAGLAQAALSLHAAPWRPPGDREPTPSEAAALRAFLMRAVALTAPRAVLVLGDQAARVLLDRAEGVLKLRGRALDNLSQPDGEAGPSTFVTFGPAFLLRQPRLKAQAWSDLLSLSATVARPRNDP